MFIEKGTYRYFGLQFMLISRTYEIFIAEGRTYENMPRTKSMQGK